MTTIRNSMTSNAVEFWNQKAAEQGERVSRGEISVARAVTTHTISRTATGLLNLSNLEHTENAWRAFNGDRSLGNFGNATFQTAISALSLAPGGRVALGVLSGKAEWGFFRTLGSGVKIPGMAALGSQANLVAGSMQRILAKALPPGIVPTDAHLQRLLNEVRAYAAPYGITVGQGGRLGEAVPASMHKLMVNLELGAAHEMTHVIQMVQTRISALEAMASQRGLSIARLNGAARAEAFKTMVKPFEDFTYAQHEMVAGMTSRLGGIGRSTYLNALTQNVDRFGAGLAYGKVPDVFATRWADMYGKLGNVLGRSQAQIGVNLAPTVGGTAAYSKND